MQQQSNCSLHTISPHAESARRSWLCDSCLCFCHLSLHKTQFRSSHYHPQQRRTDSVDCLTVMIVTKLMQSLIRIIATCSSQTLPASCHYAVMCTCLIQSIESHARPIDAGYCQLAYRSYTFIFNHHDTHTSSFIYL